MRDRFDVQAFDISIHAPTRGATIIFLLKNITPEFQSTLPREERRRLVRLFRSKFDFNPRSHERSDATPTTSRRQSSISIHAPTRGATSSSGDYSQEVENFNPRSHERSDSQQQSDSGMERDFNPRSHERSDFTKKTFPQSPKSISIHAPTRGATSTLLLSA